MIILNLKDGLGNQLFEYAYALYLQSYYPNETIAINPYSYSSKGYKGYALPYFRLSSQVEVIAPNKQRQWYFRFLLRLALKMGFRIGQLRNKRRQHIDDKCLSKLAQDGLYLSFKAFEYYPIPHTNCCNKYIHGNFEHVDYVNANADKLRDELKVCTPLSNRDKAILDDLKSSESVCVHIRRGDYLDPKWAQLNVCTYEYYNRAINYIAKQRPNAVFYVFSNTPADIEWIKANYHFDQSNIYYVTYGCPDYEEFRLMTSCKHFIISNSTFSWWAAYLGEYSDKIVVSPSRWSKTSAPQGLILDSFVKIDVD